MTGLYILLHSIQMILRNFKDVLRLTLFPIAILFGAGALGITYLEVLEGSFNQGPSGGAPQPVLPFAMVVRLYRVSWPVVCGLL